MKRFIAVLLALLITIPTTAFACGMTSSHSGHTGGGGKSGGGGGKKNTKREQWTKNRLQELKRQRREQKGRALPGGDVRDGGGLGQLNNPWLTGDEAALRRRDAIKRQQLVNAIEFLALKKERGELTPAGQQKLNELLRRVRTEH